MATPNKPYNPKTSLSPGKTPREALYPENYIPNPEKHIKRGGIMTAGIIASTFVVKQVRKDMAPDFTTKSAIPLFTVVILSSYLIDWLQRYEYIPYSI